MGHKVTWEVIFIGDAGEFRWKGNAADEDDSISQATEALPYISIVRGYPPSTPWDLKSVTPLEPLEKRTCPRCELPFLAPLTRNNVQCEPCKTANPHQRLMKGAS